MKASKVIVCLAAAAAVFGCLTAAAVPHLEPQGTTQRLVVNGQPMLIIGGELGNSSASSAAYMAPHWSRLHQMHLNTVLTPVSWELIEPTEGHFDPGCGQAGVLCAVGASRQNRWSQ